jgi:hypothetical protein
LRQAWLQNKILSLKNKNKKDAPLRREHGSGILLPRGPLRKCFLMFSHPGTQRPLQFKSAWLLLKVAADFGITLVMLDLQARRMKGLQGQRSLGGHVTVAGSESLKAAPDRAMPEAVRVKPKLKWRPQEVRGAGVCSDS